MAKKPLVQFTPSGLYCPQGKFYIDPWKPVHKAVITHAHADHAYSGHRNYLTQREGLPLLQYRVRTPNAHFYPLDYRETVTLNGVQLSLHSAGHILGSAQVRLEYNGEIWVISGDYKLDDDNVSAPFESVKCDYFITESTFGLPCFNWEPSQLIFNEINSWWRYNKSQGLTSILLGYALGKCQRLLKGIDPSIGPLYAHGAVWNITEIIRQEHPHLFPPMAQVSPEILKKDWIGSLILAPPSAAKSPWIHRFQPYRIGYASGWMTLRGIRKRYGADQGFVLSDHADWLGLQQTVVESRAKKIIVTHGFTDIFSRWLQEKGYEAYPSKSHYGVEEEDSQ